MRRSRSCIERNSGSARARIACAIIAHAGTIATPQRPEFGEDLRQEAVHAGSRFGVSRSTMPNSRPLEKLEPVAFNQPSPHLAVDDTTHEPLNTT